MYFRVLTAVLAGAALLAGAAQAQTPTPLKWMRALAPAGSHKLHVRVDAIKNGHMVPTEYAFCKAAAQNHVALSDDKSPSIAWSKGPAGTKSYAVIVYDTDSPAEHRELMNKEGATLTAAVQRKIYFHLVVVDIPTKITALPEGAESEGRVAHGKPASSKIGVVGANSYTQAFAANDAMKGTYYGYDGPCSPWNDENTHHYHFTVYALSVPSLGLSGDFGGEAAVAAMQGKVLAQGELLGVYSTNPAIMAKLKK
ncbi:MAG TPA: YbhB/YbcL family Raf kinase inhibitor-like protein [Stellaceae bacterium]|nr:YbhB/YbcL family Raf kinase inhibitor-like protein [Stellaceae bacterium]